MVHQFYLDDQRPGDSGDGLSLGSAKKTVAAMDALVKAFIPSATDDIEILIEGGPAYTADPTRYYNITASFGWSQANNHPVAGKTITWKARQDGVPGITARTAVTGWEAAPGLPGLVRAPFTGSIRNLWMTGRRLQRTSYGRLNDAARVIAWDEANDWPTVPTAQLPTVLSWSGVEIEVVIGWSKSIFRIASVNDLGGGVSAIVPMEPERTAEFTHKNNGPFRQLAAGNRFWFRNAKTFLTAPGDWYHDTSDSHIYMVPPTGLTTAAEVEAAGVWAPNSATGFMTLFGAASYLDPLKSVAFKDLRFMHFGYNTPNTEGFVGFLYDGVAWADNAGVMTFRRLPAVLTVARTQSIEIDRCEFVGIAALGIDRYFANKDLHITRCLGAQLGASLTGGNGATGTQFEAMTSGEQTLRAVREDNVMVDLGLDYPTSASFGGAMGLSRVNHNSVKRCNGGGVQIGTGGRTNGVPWTYRNEAKRNRIADVLLEVHDAGHIYIGGNQCRHSARTPSPLIYPPYETVTVSGNWMTAGGASSWHTNDPNGGHQIAVYFDLGVWAGINVGNIADGVETPMQENCSGANLHSGNYWVNYNPALTRGYRVNHSGFNVYDAATGTSTFYTPPWNNPLVGADVANWATFQTLGIITPLDAFLTPGTTEAYDGGKFNSSSIFGENFTPIVLPEGTGANPLLLERYGAYCND